MIRSITLIFRRPAVSFLPAICLGLSACAGLDEAAVGRTQPIFEAPFHVTYKEHTVDRRGDLAGQPLKGQATPDQLPAQMNGPT